LTISPGTCPGRRKSTTPFARALHLDMAGEGKIRAALHGKGRDNLPLRLRSPLAPSQFFTFPNFLNSDEDLAERISLRSPVPNQGPRFQPRRSLPGTETRGRGGGLAPLMKFTTQFAPLMFRSWLRPCILHLAISNCLIIEAIFCDMRWKAKRSIQYSREILITFHRL
jgi:hypothetical protein